MIAHSSFRGICADSNDCRDTRDSNIIKFIRNTHYKEFVDCRFYFEKGAIKIYPNKSYQNHTFSMSL